MAVNIRPTNRISVEGDAAVTKVPRVQPTAMMMRIATRIQRSTQMPMGIEKRTSGIAAATPCTTASALSDRCISAFAVSAMIPKLWSMVKPTSIAKLIRSSGRIDRPIVGAGAFVTSTWEMASINSLSGNGAMRRC